MIRLETPRLILRPFEDRDVPVFAAYRSDPEVARYQGWEAPYSILAATAFFHFMQAVKPGTPGEWFQFAVELKETGQMVGDVGLHVMKNDPRQAEFGVTFAREHHGQGYATEATARLFDYGFYELNLHRIFSRLDARNIPSEKLMERLGMRREAYFRKNDWFKGEWVDELGYAVLEEEWQRAHPQALHFNGRAADR